MKKLLAGLLILTSTILVGCKKDENNNNDDDNVKEGGVVDVFRNGAYVEEKYGTSLVSESDIEAEGAVTTNIPFYSHYNTLNYLKTQESLDLDVYADFVDGLVDLNKYDVYEGSMAESWTDEVQEDGKHVWTFDLRDNIHWHNTTTGAAVQPVVATDWRAAGHYILQPKNESELSSLYMRFIDGAEEYYCAREAIEAMTRGESTKPICVQERDWTDADIEEYSNFDKVGVKAIDDKTLQFTLPSRRDYFISALTYSVFYPVNHEYLLSKGDDFGKNTTTILSNGAYFAPKETLEEIYKVKNPAYYGVEEVGIDVVKHFERKGTLATQGSDELFENGIIDSFEVSRTDTKIWDKYIGLDFDTELTPENIRGAKSEYASVIDYTAKHTTYTSFNFGRNYKNSTSTKSPESKEATKLLLANKNFRLAIMYGLDPSYNQTRYNDKDLFENRRHFFTPAGIAEDSDGKDYIEYVFEYTCQFDNNLLESDTPCTEDQIAATKAIYDDGSVGVHNMDKALEYFEKAFLELEDDVYVSFKGVPVLEMHGTTSSAIIAAVCYD